MPAGEADWRALAGRDVLIWRDNDASGRHYANSVLVMLRPLGCRVKVIDVDLLGLAPKGDAVDWLASHPEANAADVLALACEQHPRIASDPLTYARAWRATANGLESLASLHNDGLLILDELSQCDPKEAGEAAYLLANGQGKARAHRNGTARASLRWRLLFLSAGEESLAALIARTERKANASQEVRLADFDADAGVGLGAFETLNGCASPAALSLALKDAATRHHGAAGVVWLRAVVNDRDRLPDLITGGVRQFVAENTPPDAAGQVLRVAQRFGLVEVAGERADLAGDPTGASINSLACSA